MNTQNAEVLILAHYQDIGALMAALVELAGCRAAFPLADETAPEAVRRLAPKVVLLEWDHEHSGTRALSEATFETGSAILLFSPARSTYELEQLAARCGLAAITFPLDRDRFESSLRSALAASNG